MVSNSPRGSKALEMGRFHKRPALTGLRGVAVVPVVLFHAGLRGAESGYLGVDVFFVLSGFLITSLLLMEYKNTGTISLRHFYARRVRRLLPASATTLLITALAYRWAASAMVVRDNMSSFVAGACYLSNWQFIAQAADYWAEGRDVSPVKHYWSLSVEEQYYYVFPMLLLSTLLWFRSLTAVKAGLWLGSVASVAYGAMLYVSAEPTASYMNTFARMYQLLGGGLLAVYLRGAEDRASSLSASPAMATFTRLLSAGGFCLLILLLGAGAFGLELPSFFGGVASTLLTCFLIGGLEWELVGVSDKTSGSSIARAVLQMEWLVYLGEVSFSVYLWHFPIVVIGGSLGWLPEAEIPNAVIVLASSVMMGSLSRALLEIPFSHISLKSEGRRLTAACSAILVAVLLAGALYLILTPPLPVIPGLKSGMDPYQVCFRTDRMAPNVTVADIREEIRQLEHAKRQLDAQMARLVEEEELRSWKAEGSGQTSMGEADSLAEAADREAVETSEATTVEMSEETSVVALGSVKGPTEKASEGEVGEAATDGEEAEVDNVEEGDTSCDLANSRSLRVLLMGDSHCEKAEDMMRLLGQEYNLNLTTYCLSREGVVVEYEKPRYDPSRCEWLKGMPEKMEGVDVVIVFNFGEQMVCRFEHAHCSWQGNPLATPEQTKQLVNGVLDFFDLHIFPFAPEQVVIMEPPPFASYNVKNCVLEGGGDACDFEVQHYNNYPSGMEAYQTLAAYHMEVTLVPNDDLLCPEGLCKAISDDGVMLFSDNYHIDSDYWLANAGRVADLWLDYGLDLSRRICT